MLLDGNNSRVEARRTDDGQLHLTIDEARIRMTAIRSGGKVHLFMDGENHVLAEDDPLHMSAEAAAGSAGLRSPMPGRIIELLVTPGARVAKGASLLVLEAMKIEHTIVAPEEGTLRGFKVAAGEQVGEGADLVDFEPARSA